MIDSSSVAGQAAARCLGAFLAFCVCTVGAWAQADAQDAYREARRQYADGEFATARDLLIRASQTDPRNPEVFLWLGRSHYGLGELDQAIAAWTTTLRLAPDEPYAKQMLLVLRGEPTDVAAQIRMVETLVQDGLFEAAERESATLMRERALTVTERARIQRLRVEIRLEEGEAGQALVLVRALQAAAPDAAQAPETLVLLGRALLETDDVAKGLGVLRAVSAADPGSASGILAELVVRTANLEQAPSSVTATALSDWIGAHPEHPRAERAREALIGGWLATVSRGIAPHPGTALDDEVRSALTVAEGVYAAAGPRATRLTGRLLRFFQEHYAARGAYAAAADGVMSLLQQPLSAAGRRAALGALAAHRTEFAMRWLAAQAAAGTVESDTLPRVLQDVLDVLAVIQSDFPAQPAWDEQAGLAGRVYALASSSPAPEPSTRPRALALWAVEIALPVVSGTLEPAADRAAQAVLQLVRGLRAASPDAARSVLTRLLAVLPEAHGRYQDGWQLQAELLADAAAREFDDRVQRGDDAANAELSAVQREMISALARLVRRAVATAPDARQTLASHLQPWIDHGHFALAQQAWELLAPELPAADRRQLDLAVAQLWIADVRREHQRLQEVGLSVPRTLDPRLVEAMQRLYLLQDEAERLPAFVAEVRQVWNGVVAHYSGLRYFDVAALAVRVRADRAVAAADEWSELQGARLKAELAERDLARLLQRHDGARQIEVTAEFRVALDAFTAFLGDHPGSALAPHAVEGILRIAVTFQQHRAFRAEAQVLGDFAAFADRIPVTAQVDPLGTSVAQRAWLGRARALHAEGTRALAEGLAGREPDAGPVDQLNAEFEAAIAAYRDFLTRHPGSVLVGTALNGIMNVGLEHAQADAWGIAERVFADLLGAGLALRRPERLDFCRGLCRLGPSMPGHALEVLRAVVSGAAGADQEPSGAAPVSGASASDADAIDGSRTFFLGAAFDRIAPAEARVLAVSESRESSGEDVLRLIRQQEVGRAAQVAQLRDQAMTRFVPPQGEANVALSDAELARLRTSIDAAYEVFLGIIRSHADTDSARQARAEVFAMVGLWRSLSQWEDATRLAERFLKDQPDDPALPQLRLEIARDYLSLAAAPVEGPVTKQVMLATVGDRFDAARTALRRIVDEFPRQRELLQQAQWDIARSWWTQAQVVAAFSSTLARGQFVRASRALLRVAAEYHDHPNVDQVPDMLWSIAEELVRRSFFEEAIIVFDDLTVRYPAHPRAEAARLRVAQVYQSNLAQPLRAAEAYQELNFARGGGDLELQGSIFQIGVQLQFERRWVEALYVLETFVDSFPQNPNAGFALTLLGNIHQVNEAWSDAIAAYRRVIRDHPQGDHVKSARWSIAECVINLSRWSDAIAAYREFVRMYPGDPQSGEANERIAILKDLERYQRVVDEVGQRKAFDAQYQIAKIVRERLANPVKAIIEFGRVTERWPQSHLADDALYEVGATQLTLGDTERARRALIALAADYPTSPLADDALYLVGKSYEDEAQSLNSVTREESVEKAKDQAQRRAFAMAQDERRRQNVTRGGRIAGLKEQGQVAAAEREAASNAAYQGFFLNANVDNFAQWAEQEAVTLTATELADRQDKIDAAMRRAVASYSSASGSPGGDKAGDALLAMARIQHDHLKDVEAATATWLEIVRQFSGTAVAEDASWRIAQYYEQARRHEEAVDAYGSFLRNYRRSPKAGDAQIAIAETYEQLGQWVNAMDAYTNYINNFPAGPLLEKAREQIQWIKTYRL